MIKKVILILLSLTAICALGVEDIIWPKPHSIQMGNQVLSFSKYCQILYKFKDNTFPNSYILDRMLSLYLKNYFGQPLVFLNYNCSRSITWSIKNELCVTPYPMDATQAKEIEYYKLKISVDEITIEVNYINGVIRALETLSQILQGSLKQDMYTIPSTPLIIEDFPSFPIRGIMIDSSRHFISIPKIKMIIDGMMHSKLNTLHWHITDDDNFSFESKSISSISSGNEVYTQNEIRDLINYGKIRGVQIIPEFDQPGHVRSWGINQELSNLTILNQNEKYYGYLDPSSNFTFDTALTILNEVIGLFKSPERSPWNSSDFMHMGGDEINYSIWLKNEKVAKFMSEKGFSDEYDLLNYYFNRIRQGVPQNKNYLYWIDSEFFTKDKYKNLEIFKASNTIFHYWGNISNLKNFNDNPKFINGKLNIILSPYDFTYLDCGTANIYGDRSWCDPFITWKKIYQFNPNDYNKNQLNVLGSIACLWSELVDDSNIIGKIFPRASALSERLWSKFEANQEVDVKSAYRRLITFNRRLLDKKIETTRISNKFCEENINECISQVR